MEIRFSFRQYIILQEQESRSDSMFSDSMKTVRLQSTGIIWQTRQLLILQDILRLMELLRRKM
jgi:type IV secretory pathway component VirB8